MCVTLCVQIKMYILSLLQTCFVHLSTQCVVSMQRLVCLVCCLSGEEEQERRRKIKVVKRERERVILPVPYRGREWPGR